jgi:hypothetical protein
MTRKDSMKDTHRSTLAAAVALTVLCALTACSTWDKLDRTERGAVIGTGGGAALGAAVGGTEGAVLGGVVGGVAGGVIGHKTDDDKK